MPDISAPVDCTSETVDDAVEETLVFEDNDDDDECTEVNSAQTTNTSGQRQTYEKGTLELEEVNKKASLFPSGNQNTSRKRSYAKDNVIQAIEKRVEERSELIKKLLIEKEDETDLFFRSISETVKKFSPILRNEAKMHVMTIISKLESQSLMSSQAISPPTTAVHVFSGTSTSLTEFPTTNQGVASSSSGISSVSMSPDCFTAVNTNKPGNMYILSDEQQGITPSECSSRSFYKL